LRNFTDDEVKILDKAVVEDDLDYFKSLAEK